MFASARRLAAMQSLSSIPGVQLMHMDVCSSDSIQAAVAEVVSKAGRIDVLVRGGAVLLRMLQHAASAHHDVGSANRSGKLSLSWQLLLLLLCVLTPTSCVSWDPRSTMQVRGTESQRLMCHLQAASGSTLQHAQLLLSEWQMLMFGGRHASCTLPAHRRGDAGSHR